MIIINQKLQFVKIWISYADNNLHMQKKPNLHWFANLQFQEQQVLQHYLGLTAHWEKLSNQPQSIPTQEKYTALGIISLVDSLMVNIVLPVERGEILALPSENDPIYNGKELSQLLYT